MGKRPLGGIAAESAEARKEGRSNIWSEVGAPRLDLHKFRCQMRNLLCGSRLGRFRDHPNQLHHQSLRPLHRRSSKSERTTPMSGRSPSDPPDSGRTPPGCSKRSGAPKELLLPDGCQQRGEAEPQLRPSCASCRVEERETPRTTRARARERGGGARPWAPARPGRGGAGRRGLAPAGCPPRRDRGNDGQDGEVATQGQAASHGAPGRRRRRRRRRPRLRKCSTLLASVHAMEGRRPHPRLCGEDTGAPNSRVARGYF